MHAGARAGALLAIVLVACATAAVAVESDPLPVPKGGARQRAVTAYNEGVKLMVDKRYAAAQQKFEEALAADEKLAEAHNNLAFSLRMQGTHNRERALRHYNRALELKPVWRAPTCIVECCSPRWVTWSVRGRIMPACGRSIRTSPPGSSGSWPGTGATSPTD